MSQAGTPGASEHLAESSSDSAEKLALAVSKERQKQKRASNKASISRGAEPLKVPGPRQEAAQAKTDAAFRAAWRRTAGELSEEEQRAAVLKTLEVFRLLPPSSSYAQHRIRVLEKALLLLDKPTDRSAEERDELQQLLSQLKI